MLSPLLHVERGMDGGKNGTVMPAPNLIIPLPFVEAGVVVVVAEGIGGKSRVIRGLILGMERVIFPLMEMVIRPVEGCHVPTLRPFPVMLVEMI